jgi:hypothetical protein
MGRLAPKPARNKIEDRSVPDKSGADKGKV